MGWGLSCEVGKKPGVRKFHSFTDSNSWIITYADFINFLKNKDESFFELFVSSLNSATNALGAYFWECPPVTKNTLNRPFEFVVTKSEELNNIKQDYSSFQEHLINNSKFGLPIDEVSAVSFPNKNKDAILVIPMLISKKMEINKGEIIHQQFFDYKNLSEFTKNAPSQQQKEFWKEVVEQLTKNLEESNEPKWLSTHGLGVPYLHVRIDNQPKYYSHEEYKEFKEIPKQQPTSSDSSTKNLKEKILSNLDKICIDSHGNLANAEVMKQEEANKFFAKEVDENSSEFKEWREKVWKIEVNGEALDLEKLELEDFFNIKEELIQQIKQNPHEWIIEETTHWRSRYKYFLRNKKTGTKHWQSGFIFVRKRKNGKKITLEERDVEWKKLKASIENSSYSQIDKANNTSNSASTNLNNDKNSEGINFLPWIIGTGVLGFTIFVLFNLIQKKPNKKKL